MNYSTKNQGFSLIETFVAITILMVAVLGPMTLFSKVISDSIFARNQITAFYLAQEGLELAIDHRNHNGGWWKTLNCDDGCYIAFQDGQGAIIDDKDAGPLFYDNKTGVYSYDKSGKETIFNRKIVTENQDVYTEDGLGVAEGVRVNSVVEWTYRGADKTTSVSTLLYQP